MKRITISMTLLSLLLGTTVSVETGCNGSSCSTECGEDPAWRCAVSLFNTFDTCGPEGLAQATCDAQGGGEVYSVPACEGAGGGGSDGGSGGSGGNSQGGVDGVSGADETAGAPAWDPSEHIVHDLQSGQYFIDGSWLQDVRDDPSPLLADGTTAVFNSDGDLQIKSHGPLAGALGLVVGDILVALNGQPLNEGSLWSTISQVQNATAFQLIVRRGRNNPQTIVIDVEVQ